MVCICAQQRRRSPQWWQAGTTRSPHPLAEKMNLVVRQTLNIEFDSYSCCELPILSPISHAASGHDWAAWFWSDGSEKKSTQLTIYARFKKMEIHLTCALHGLSSYRRGNLQGPNALLVSQYARQDLLVWIHFKLILFRSAFYAARISSNCISNPHLIFNQRH